MTAPTVRSSEFVSNDLSELTAHDVREYVRRRPTVLIPLGAHEQHGPHLPLGTDVITALSVTHRVCDQLGTLHTPAVWAGYSPQHMYEPGNGRGTVTLRASTYVALIHDVGRSLIHQGFDRLVFVNGHGGNKTVIDPALRELRHATGALVVFVHAILDGGTSTGMFDDILTNDASEMPGGHGSELEASQDLAWNPELVRLDRAERHAVTGYRHLPGSFVHPDGRSGLHFESRPHVQAPWDYADSGEYGAPGDATSATAQKGRRALDRLAAHVARAVVELESVDVAVHTRDFAGRFI